MPSRQSDEVLVVGDLHGHFDAEDERFLAARAPALTVFVGDLGDENPRITQRVMDLTVPVKVLLGNHDAWESFRYKKVSDKLQQSLDILGDAHLAYDCVDLDDLGVSLVGARPFSWGGPSLRSPEVYTALYGVGSHEQSAERILEAAVRARHETLVVIAHNGPVGLGSQPSAIFGKDFGKPGGDWGDLDLRIAIRKLKERGFNVPLCVAGHMHHRLAYPRGSTRRRCVVASDTTYVNTARVPRIFMHATRGTVRHYTSIRFSGGELTRLVELYVSADGIREVALAAHDSYPPRPCDCP